MITVNIQVNKTLDEKQFHIYKHKVNIYEGEYIGAFCHKVHHSFFSDFIHY